MFFIYDPVRAAPTPVRLNGDTLAMSVGEWKDVDFSAPKPGQKLLEVRYGFLENPLPATVVASAIRTER
ncbi:hypothetical protein OHV05_37195 (plasmid) [Kitasatospora sp. NBC_00070]|uniref:hypothetical protein n=1 Tax=Kitasatospora sp. NBC_00070 TaxID=2975962 RepID=UPI002F9183E6